MSLGGRTTDCGALLGSKAAIVSDTRLLRQMTVGAILGFGIGSFLDWRENKRGHGLGTSTEDMTPVKGLVRL